MLSIHGVLLEGKDPLTSVCLLRHQWKKLSSSVFVGKRVREPVEFKHVSFHLTPENATGVGPTEILEMEKGIWKCFEPKTTTDIRSIDALSMDVVISEIHIKQMRGKKISNCSMKGLFIQAQHHRFHDNGNQSSSQRCLY